MVKRMLPWMLLILGLPHIVTADPLYRVSQVTAIAAHGADLAETEHCLGSGRCVEMNPWLARFKDPSAFGAAKMGVAALGLWATDKIPNRVVRIVVNFGVASAYFSIAAHNSRVSR